MSISDLRAPALETEGSNRRLEHLKQWRTAAQRVAAAWGQWLTCDATERDWAHEVYADALAREEEAALRLERDVKATCEP